MTIITPEELAAQRLDLDARSLAISYSISFCRNVSTDIDSGPQLVEIAQTFYDFLTAKPSEAQ